MHRKLTTLKRYDYDKITVGSTDGYYLWSKDCAASDMPNPENCESPQITMPTESVHAHGRRNTPY